jgi:hypothetical protein
MMINPETAAKIANRDPDGGRTRPKQIDRDNHRQWVIDTYGPKAWKDYVEGNVRSDSRI